ncbi:MAG: ribosomal RNA small subunit methyltransferase A [Deltaproteobacteria bacterium]|nr:MAG: ribosomal RNA small subunit methyltransferase A [Deltaproteobacteria bacterium]
MSGGFDDPRAVLRLLEQRARRRFGQHFLCEQGVVDRIVRRAGISPGDKVLEIGPGLGILTHALTRAGAELTAVELDRDLADHIERVFPGVRLVRGDALDQRWPELLGGVPHKVVANLPYNVGTRVVMDLIDHPGLFPSVVVMLQKEVVDRLLAPPGSRTYGALSVVAQARARLAFLLAVPPRSFYPPPKVDSSVIRLEPLPEPDTGGVPVRDFDRVVKAAFSQRRKVIANSLGALFGRDEARTALERAGVDPRTRAEQVDLAGFQRIARALYPSHQA